MVKYIRENLPTLVHGLGIAIYAVGMYIVIFEIGLRDLPTKLFEVLAVVIVSSAVGSYAFVAVDFLNYSFPPSAKEPSWKKKLYAWCASDEHQAWLFFQRHGRENFHELGFKCSAQVDSYADRHYRLWAEGWYNSHDFDPLDTVEEYRWVDEEAYYDIGKPFQPSN